MIELRPFRNSDSQGIAAVWNEQPPLRGRLKTITTALLEQHVLAKPYFDPLGLVVACEAERVVGFVHAGFMPGALPGELKRGQGIICQLIVSPSVEALQVSAQLLGAAETFLQTAGANEFYGGGLGEHSPFYLGLYGGCQLPGVLASDTSMAAALRAGGYTEHCAVEIWQRELSAFRPPIDRELIGLRRQFQLRLDSTSSAEQWSDTCIYCWIDRTRLEIVSIAKKNVSHGVLTFWDMEPLASNWGVRAMGLADASFDMDISRRTCWVWLLTESIRHFQGQGISLVEIQTGSGESDLLEACRKLGFQMVDRGIQFRKLAGSMSDSALPSHHGLARETNGIRSSGDVPENAQRQ